MNTKKFFVLLGVTVGGAIILGITDHLLGINFSDVNRAAEIFHKTVYMIFGGIIFTILGWDFD